MMEVLKMQIKYKNIVVCVNDGNKVMSIYQYLLKSEFTEVDVIHDQTKERSIEKIEKKWMNSSDESAGLILVCQEVDILMVKNLTSL